jgi:hypothetical protein
MELIATVQYWYITVGAYTVLQFVYTDEQCVLASESS